MVYWRQRPQVYIWLYAAIVTRTHRILVDKDEILRTLMAITLHNRARWARRSGAKVVNNTSSGHVEPDYTQVPSIVLTVWIIIDLIIRHITNAKWYCQGAEGLFSTFMELTWRINAFFRWICTSLQRAGNLQASLAHYTTCPPDLRSKTCLTPFLQLFQGLELNISFIAITFLL